jgi:sterol desaturase/sphingolipid hydroxylase (fatty acid hydroxylase superfamily)
VLERLCSAVRQPQSERWVNNVYLPVSLAWICALQASISPSLSRLVNLAGGGLLSQILPPRPSLPVEIAISIVFAVAWDVWQYWVHRWQHASPILWQIHKLHHSDPNVTSSTQARNHPLNYVYFILCYIPVLLVFGVVAPHSIAAVLMFRVWGFVNHANVRISFGRLTGIITGPQWHRIHHSVQAEHVDKNFAAYFPFIDRLFGTYYRPAPGEYPQTGLINEEPEPFMRAVTIAPVVAWYQTIRLSIHLTPHWGRRRLREQMRRGAARNGTERWADGRNTS